MISLSLLNLYNPIKTVTAEELSFYFQQLETPRVVLGNFNARHGLWSSKKNTNATGRDMISALLCFLDLCLLTPKDCITYVHVSTRQFSTLDLYFLFYHKAKVESTGSNAFENFLIAHNLK